MPVWGQEGTKRRTNNTHTRWRTLSWWAEAALCVVRRGARRAWYVRVRGTSMCTLCVVYLCACHASAHSRDARGEYLLPQEYLLILQIREEKKFYIYSQWALCLEVLFMSVRATVTNLGTISKQLLLDSGHKITKFVTILSSKNFRKTANH